MRKHYIDNLRSGIVLLVIFYHAIYLFNTVGVISNIGTQGVRQADTILYFIYPWFMVCMFLLAGISARYSLEHRSIGNFLKERLVKLLIPGFAGIFLFSWITGMITSHYVPMFDSSMSIPSIIKYLIYCLVGIGPLWFVYELFLACLILALIRKIDKKDRLWTLSGRINIWGIILLVIPVWGSSLILNLPMLEIFRNGIYLFFFLLGYFVFSHEDVIGLLVGKKYLFLTLGVISGIAFTIFHYGENYTSMDILKEPLTNFFAYFMTIALLGCAKAWFDKENTFTKYMRKRSYGFYLIHYPLMVLLAFILDVATPLPVIAIYPILIAAEIVLLAGIYEGISNVPILRTLVFGITQKRTSH